MDKEQFLDRLRGIHKQLAEDHCIFYRPYWEPIYECQLCEGERAKAFVQADFLNFPHGAECPLGKLQCLILELEKGEDNG